MRLNNIRLLVKDFDTCFTFYHNTLGLECTWGKLGEHFASFTVGIPSGLSIFSAELMDQAIDKPHVPRSNKEDKAVLILEVDNVDEMHSKLQSKGVTFITQPKDMPVWGIRVVHFRDPENNLIELFEALPAKN